MSRLTTQFTAEIFKKMSFSRKTKKYFLKELTPQIDCYCSDHPDATLDDLYLEFGNPDEFSENLADSARFREMIRRAKKKTALFIFLSVVLALAAAVAVGFVVWLIYWYSGEIISIKVSEITTIPVD